MKTIERRDPMRHVHFMRSSTFHWAAILAAVFAAFVTVLFGFIYFKIDDYLVARSDRMISLQMEFYSALTAKRRVGAIEDHLGQDSRGVQFVGLFDAGGKRIAGNIDRLPADLKIDSSVQSVRIARAEHKELGDPLVRAVAGREDGGDTLVIGRNVD